jgi:hypothetical protein
MFSAKVAGIAWTTTTAAAAATNKKRRDCFMIDILISI